MQKIRLIAGLTAVVVLFSVGYAEKRAILIQVSQYRDPNINSFVGTDKAKVLDNERMKNALRQHGFTQFVELSEQQATRAAIREQMEAVRRQTQPSDVVVFYYSGHGAVGRQGVSIAPHDAVAQDSSGDLTGDELAAWVRSLPTQHVVIILDCCFYFRPPRDPKTGRDRPVALYPKVIVARRERANSWGQLAQLEKGVVLTAANLGQSAYQMFTGRYDRGTNTGEWVGIFTHVLSQTIEQAARQGGSALNYQHLVNQSVQETRRAIAILGSSHQQTPQILGDERLRTMPIFQTAGEPRMSQPPSPPPAPPRTVIPQGRVYIDPAVPNELAQRIRRELQARQPEVVFTQDRFEATHVVERRGRQIVQTDVYGLTEVVLAEIDSENDKAGAAAAEKLHSAITNHAALRVIIETYHQHFAHKPQRLQLLTNRNSYRNGEEVLIRLTPSRSGYLILLSRTSDDQLVLLFPTPADNDKNLLLEAGTRYVFPPENADYAYKVDAPSGKDFVCAIVVDTVSEQNRLLEALGARTAIQTPDDSKGVVRVPLVKNFADTLAALVSAGKCEIAYVEFLVEN